MYSIVLVDDHAIVREGFKRLIEMEPDLEVVAECRCADDAVEALNGARRTWWRWIFPSPMAAGCR